MCISVYLWKNIILMVDPWKGSSLGVGRLKFRSNFKLLVQIGQNGSSGLIKFNQVRSIR